MNWLYYLAEANLYLGVFYLAYCLFLTKETYYQLTRAYLLFACVVSFILPVLQIGALKPVETAVATTVAYTLPEYTGPQEYLPINTAPVVMEHHLTVDDYLIYIYFIGAAIAFILLMVKLFVLFKLMRNAKRIAQDKHMLVYLPQTNVAFSFFNYLFIGAEAHGANTIIRHELVHIRQKHSVDIVFVELLKVVSWFNPFIYLLQNSLKTVHEYIADEQTAAFETDALTYSSFLVNNAYGAGGSSITHSFFNYNLLKKRIVMLNQKRSGNLARLRYLVTVPLCAGLLCVSTLAFSKTYGWVDIDPAKHVNIEVPKIVPPAQKVVKPKGFKYPLPTISTDGYEKLITYLSKTMRYDDALIKPTNIIVVINFKVNADRKITDAKISGSGGSAFDALAMNALKSYKGTVNAKPGNRNLMFDFYANDSTPEEMAIVNGNLDGRAGFVVIIPNRQGNGPVKFPPPVVKPDKAGPVNFPPPIVKPALPKRDKNGAYINTGRLNNGAVPILTVAPKGTAFLFIVDGKKYEFTPESLSKYNAKSLLYMSCDKMLVYLQGNPYIKKTWGKAYGKVAVLTGNASIKIVADPFAENKETRDLGTGPDWTAIGKYFSRNIKYPAADRQDLIAGRVITYFAIDADHNLQYAKVVRTPSAAMGDEVIRTLKACTEFGALKPGVQYVSSVAFTLGYEDGTDGVDTKSRSTGSPTVYNPNSIDIPMNTADQLVLNDVVIRGYVKRTAAITETAKPDFEQFYKHLSQNIHYPSVDRKDTISGRVITVFAVDANGSLQYAKVVRTPSVMMGDEVIRVLKKWPRFSWFKPGVQYTVSVTFTLGYEDSSTGIKIEPKYRDGTGSPTIYNPNSVDIPANPAGSLMLNDIILRGYIKKQ
jgi:outer membrane biosynthesis protein TonB